MKEFCLCCRSKDVGESMIQCHNLDDAPILPKALSDLDEESLKLRHEHLLVSFYDNTLTGTNHNTLPSALKSFAFQQNLESLLETKIKSDGFRNGDFFGDDDSKKPKKYTIGDNSFLQGFLSGKECLNGVRNANCFSI